MTSSLHRALVLDDIHSSIFKEYADTAARTSDTSLVAADKHKFVVQLDNQSVWRLENHSPVTWRQVGTMIDHKATHENGGVDELDVTDLSGKLADEQNAGWIKNVEVDLTDVEANKPLVYLPNSTFGFITNSFLEKLTADTTYYVEETGDDGNDGLSIGTAVRQPQTIINRLPHELPYKTTVLVGSGTFEPVIVSNFVVGPTGGFTLSGTTVLATLSTGSNSGTFGASTDYVGTDTTQTWTPGELAGKFVKVDSAYYTITKNDATTISISTRKYGGFTGKAYTIEDCTSVITRSAFGPTLLCENIRSGTNELKVEKFRLAPTSFGQGLYIDLCNAITARTFQIFDAYTWGCTVLRAGIAVINEIYIQNPTWGFCNMGFNNDLRPYGIVGKDGGASSSWAGITFEANNFINGLAAYIENNQNGNGINIRGCKMVSPSNNNIECVNNDGHGIYVRNSQFTSINHNDFKGSGNGGHGVFIDRGARVVVKTGTNITGAAGDYSLGGKTGSWSDLANDLDIISDPVTDSSVKRIDGHE